MKKSPDIAMILQRDKRGGLRVEYHLPELTGTRPTMVAVLAPEVAPGLPEPAELVAAFDGVPFVDAREVPAGVYVQVADLELIVRVVELLTIDLEAIEEQVPIMLGLLKEQPEHARHFVRSKLEGAALRASAEQPEKGPRFPRVAARLQRITGSPVWARVREGLEQLSD